MFREETLPNGLRVRFGDESNRYFGDYHRVCVVATILLNPGDLPSAVAEDAILRDRAVAAFGDELRVVRRLERMAVPTAEVDSVRTALVDDFLRHAATYLARPGTPRSLALAELSRRGVQRFHA